MMFSRIAGEKYRLAAPDFASVGFHAKGPGVDLQVERAEEITGVTGASTPASIYNSIQTVGATGSGIHVR